MSITRLKRLILAPLSRAIWAKGITTDVGSTRPSSGVYKMQRASSKFITGLIALASSLDTQRISQPTL